MARGTKLDLAIGADFSDGWQQIEELDRSTPNQLLSPKEHRLIFKKERRRGKAVTLVGPFALEKDTMKTYVKAWKRKLGCGGTCKEAWMEFQGDIASKLRPLLLSDGFSLK